MFKCNGIKYIKYVKLLKNFYILIVFKKIRNFKVVGC